VTVIDITTGEAPAEPGGPARPGGRGSARRARWVLALVTLACAVYAAVAGTLYWNAAHDRTLAADRARDRALAAGRADLTALSGIDARSTAAIGKGLDGWLAATSGPLHSALAAARDSDAAQLAKAGTLTTATVTDAALTQIDADAGTAQMIASVSVVVTPKAGGSGAPGTERQRFRASLSRSGGADSGRWTIESLTAIPAGGGD